MGEVGNGEKAVAHAPNEEELVGGGDIGGGGVGVFEGDEFGVRRGLFLRGDDILANARWVDGGGAWCLGVAEAVLRIGE